MYYKLALVGNNDKNTAKYIADTDPSEDYILQITKFPTRQTYKNSNKKFDDSKNFEKTLKKCINILHQQYSIREEDIMKGRNIYCPIHENSKTSKTPSAKLNVKSGYFTCFSSNCTIPVNEKTGYRQLPIAHLLKKI